MIVDRAETWKLLTGGVNEVARVVSRTYGPRGGKVLVEKAGSVLATTDGAALTQESQLGGSYRLGARMVREAALKTEKEAGDGTSTTVLVTSALLRELGKCAADPDWDPVRIVREIREAARAADQYLENSSVEATEEVLRRVALMAAHGEEIVSERVLEAVLEVGEEGSVVMAPYEGTSILLERKEGLVLDSGWVSRELSPSDSTERGMDGPLVAVFGSPLRKMEDVTAAMEEASQWPGRGLIVFAPSIQGTALATLVLNNQKGVLPGMAVGFVGSPKDLRDWLEDISAVTRASIVDWEKGMDPRKFSSEWLGYARKAVVSRDRTILVSYEEDEVLASIDSRARELRTRAEKTEFPYEKDRLLERAGALDGGFCTLKVGGVTKQEGQDRRSRIEDALRAVQSALRGGVVPGAGKGMGDAARSLPDTEGARVLAKGLREPLRVLALRSKKEPEVILSRGIPEGWVGWDPVSDTVRDFSESPVVADPTEVLRSALRNAVSVACTIALSGVVLTKR